MGFSQNLFLIITALVVLADVATACSDGQCRILDGCSSNQDCEAGLYCSSCLVGFSGSRCVRSTITNQFKLLNGARALMFDTYDFQGDSPTIDTLKKIEAFLSANPTKIVILILKDYVQALDGLTKVFTDAGLMKYWFLVTKIPQNDGMVYNNQRLLDFTLIQSKKAREGIAYQWNYMVENQYGDDGMKAESCANKDKSSPLDDKSRSLVWVNFFRSISMKELSCEHNSEESHKHASNLLWGCCQ
ncbi:hypothetical protein NC651_037144 [Populus alba x Populus x berolinensis]|nr:hypothetical protein NC651_037144 [Populus alba x Populus x berolinensis]